MLCLSFRWFQGCYSHSDGSKYDSTGIENYTLKNALCSCTYRTGLKGTHTVYFSSSLYIKNQKPMIPRTDFHCITT